MKKFIIENDTVYHCPIKSIAKRFCNILHNNNNNNKWINGLSYKDCNYWDCHKENTCYLPYKNGFSHINYYKNKYYKIISVNDSFLKRYEKNNINYLLW